MSEHLEAAAKAMHQYRDRSEWPEDGCEWCRKASKITVEAWIGDRELYDKRKRIVPRMCGHNSDYVRVSVEGTDK